MILFLPLFFTLFSTGFAKPSKVGISPHILRSSGELQTLDLTFPLEGGDQNTFEIASPPLAEKLLLLGFTLNGRHLWLKKSPERPHKQGYATWSYTPDQGVLTVKMAPQKLPSQGEAKLSFSVQGLSGQGPFRFTLRAFKEGDRGSSLQFTDEIFGKASD